jgi:mRNA interferase MazF
MVIRRLDVYLVELDPTVGSEMQKRRPCVVVSSDEMNRFLDTVLVAPMTSARKEYPSRVQCTFQRRRGEVALDQLRCVDRSRLIRRLGRLQEETGIEVLNLLVEIFSPPKHDQK